MKYRATAITIQITSTTPNGQVPARNPYTLDKPQPIANASTNNRCQRSSTYITIMNVSALAPYTVIISTVWRAPARSCLLMAPLWHEPCAHSYVTRRQSPAHSRKRT